MGEYDELQRQQEQQRRNLQRIEEELSIYAAGGRPIRLLNQRDRELEVIEALDARLTAWPRDEAGQPLPTDRGFADLEARYRQQVAELYGPLSFQGLERDISLQDISLEDVFVKLTLTVERVVRRRVERPTEEAAGERFRLFGRRGEAGRQREAERAEREVEIVERVQEPISLGKALAEHPNLLISGEPGAGKTTLLRWLAVTFARDLQGQPDRLGPEFAEPRLPILVELGRFAHRFMDEEARIAPPNLEAIIAETLGVEFPDLPTEFLDNALGQGHCLVLCDGFDEIADQDARRRAVRSLQTFARRHLPTGNRLVIGSRPYGHREMQNGFPCCTIQPFAPEDVQRFIEQWYDLDTALTSEERRETAQTLFDKIKAEPRILKLAQTPLLSTIIILVYRNRGDLPERRVELYEHCVRILLERWEEDKDIAESGVIGRASWRTQLRLLQPVAYHIHSAEQRTLARGEELLPVLAEALVKEGLCEADKAGQEAEQFLAALGRRSALFQHLGGDVYAFPHLTFQEYLTARYIAAQPDPDYIDLFMPHLYEAWWWEVHLLTIGHLGSGSDGAPKASALLEAVLTRYKPPLRSLRAFPYRGGFFGRLRNLPGRAFPRWQLVRRLAWAIQRERFFAATALGDCAPLGVTNEARERIRVAVEDALLLAVANASWRGAPLFDTAASSLIRLEQVSTQLVTALATALRDGKRSVPRTAASALARLAQINAEAITVLLTALDDTTKGPFGTHPVAQAAASGLGELDQLTPAVITALIGALKDEDAWVRLSAAFSLGKLRHSTLDAVDALIAAIGDSSGLSGLVQAAAVSSLGRVGQAEAEVIAALVAALGNSSMLVQKLAAQSLGQLGQANASAIDALLAALGDGEESVRRVAASALSLLDQASPELAAALVASLGDGDERVRSEAASSLVRLEQANPEAITVLVNDLSHSSMDVRRAAARSLGMLEQAGTEVIAALVAVLGDSETLVQQAGAKSLVQLGEVNPEVTAALVGALVEGKEDVRQAAAQSLGWLGQRSPEVINALETALGDSDNRVQQEAASSLVQLNESGSAVVPILLGALSSADGRVRLKAASSLIQVGQAASEVLVALNRNLHDSDRVVHLTHKLLPGLLEGKPIPGDEWRSLKKRRERRKRRLRWAALILAMVLPPLAYVLGVLYVPWVRENLLWILAAVGVWIGILAYIARIRQGLGDLWR